MVPNTLTTDTLGAASGGFLAKVGEGAYNTIVGSPELSISTNMCRGPKLLTIAVNERGEELVVTDIAAQYPISHILSLKNDGSEVITDYDLNISLFPKNLAGIGSDVSQFSSQGISNALEQNKILDFVLFYESSASAHQLRTSLGHAASTIALKDFNPGDEIFVVFESRTPWTASVVLKGPGLTYSESHGGNCGFFQDGSYGGVVKYRWVAEECESKEYPNLDLSCSMEAKLPKEFSPDGIVNLELRPER